jgi:hypothetical protein
VCTVFQRVYAYQCFGSESGSALEPHSMGSWKKENLVPTTRKKYGYLLFSHIVGKAIGLIMINVIKNYMEKNFSLFTFGKIS